MSLFRRRQRPGPVRPLIDQLDEAVTEVLRSRDQLCKMTEEVRRAAAALLTEDVRHRA